MTELAHPWILTCAGRPHAVLDPQWDQISIDEIAHALATSTRFNGHASRPYSIAEHSLLVAEICERDLGVRDPAGLLAALLHDASEAYLGDLASPVKWQLPRYQQLEAEHEHAVAKRFGLRTAFAAFHQQIRRADLVALATERRDLMPPHHQAWEALDGIAPITWDQLNRSGRETCDWMHWRGCFRDRFDELQFARGLLSRRVLRPFEAPAKSATTANPARSSPRAAETCSASSSPGRTVPPPRSARAMSPHSARSASSRTR